MPAAGAAAARGKRGAARSDESQPKLTTFFRKASTASLESSTPAASEATATTAEAETERRKAEKHEDCTAAEARENEERLQAERQKTEEDRKAKEAADEEQLRSEEEALHAEQERLAAEAALGKPMEEDEEPEPAGSEEESQQPWKKARLNTISGSPEGGTAAGDSEKLPLRERLLAKLGTTRASPTKATSEADGTGHDHKAMGGLDFNWRFLFDAKVRLPRSTASSSSITDPAAKARSGASSAGQTRMQRNMSLEELLGDTTASKPEVATPCRQDRALQRRLSSPLRSNASPTPTGSSHKAAFPEKHPSASSKSAASPTTAPKRRTSSSFDHHSDSETASNTSPVTSIADLKARLVNNGVDISECVERTDLQFLHDRFKEFCDMGTDSLRIWCMDAGATLDTVLHGTRQSLAALAIKLEQQEHRHAFEAKKIPPEPTASTSSRAAASPTSLPARTSSRTCANSPPPCQAASSSSGASPGAGGQGREREAVQEIARILSLQKYNFRSSSAWAKAVLGVNGVSDVGVAQRSHRLLMRKLHPDRVGALADADKAMELVHEAKSCLERALSGHAVPSAPRNGSARVKCAVHGKREVELRWESPANASTAPVHRYVVAAFDPSYGKMITVAVLEADYSEELKRFISVEELQSYVLEEKELRKTPALFRQSTLTVQIAAANEVGQSAWTTLRVPVR
jgi:hypothetical protein